MQRVTICPVCLGQTKAGRPFIWSGDRILTDQAHIFTLGRYKTPRQLYLCSKFIFTLGTNPYNGDQKLWRQEVKERCLSSELWEPLDSSTAFFSRSVQYHMASTRTTLLPHDGTWHLSLYQQPALGGPRLCCFCRAPCLRVSYLKPIAASGLPLTTLPISLPIPQSRDTEVSRTLGTSQSLQPIVLSSTIIVGQAETLGFKPHDPWMPPPPLPGSGKQRLWKVSEHCVF